MWLTLDRLDSKPEHMKANCQDTRFGMFEPQAQAAIRAVGKAQFREFDGSAYNAIYPPKEADDA